MIKNNDEKKSILIVSASDQFNLLVKNSLKGFVTIDTVKSASLARRRILEREYDLTVVNAPLPDETGEELVMDIAEESDTALLLVAPRENYEDVLERVTDSGVLAIPKPSPKGRIDKGIRFLAAQRRRVAGLRKKVGMLEDKLEEQRLVSRAKLCLMEKQHMSEDEAHRYIGKTAMDHGISRKAAATMILDSDSF